ncbi:hypothetical protein GCM10009126_27270 [Rhodanobacter caeni]|uniref:Uncharacterized protein n=1 Tax=Rhodanobacter caeni TaxID=657654 RepID=A0ABN0USW6_9GAMM
MNVYAAIREGFLDGMRLARAIVSIPVAMVLLCGILLSSYVHHRPFRVLDAVSAAKRGTLGH